jgi:hypothetical protein
MTAPMNENGSCITAVIFYLKKEKVPVLHNLRHYNITQ